MLETVDDGTRWMSRWGLFDRPASIFIGQRPLRVLDAHVRPLPVPAWLQGIGGYAYNPSTSLTTAAVRKTLNCSECRRLISLRVDWVNGCKGELLSDLFAATVKRQDPDRLGVRKLTLIGILAQNWEPIAWGWLKLSTQTPVQEQALNNSHAMRVATSVVDARLFIHQGRVWLVSYRPSGKWQAHYGRLHLLLKPSSPMGKPKQLVAWQNPATTRVLTGKSCGGRSQAFFEAPQSPSRSLRRPPGAKSSLHGPLRSLAWLAPETVVCTTRAHGGARMVSNNTAPREFRGQGLGALRSQLTSCLKVGSGGGNCRISLNGLIIPLPRSDLLLGVGHLHRGDTGGIRTHAAISLST